MRTFDFYTDLRTEISDILNKSGLKISLDQNIHKLLIDFFNLKSKILEPKKRNVFIVSSLKEQIKTHPKKLEIQTILKYAEAGENLNCFQSDKIIQSKQIDHLSNEWNIFHFHLSLKPDKKPKFVKRGNLLLFAYIDDENVVFLGIAPHRDSFSDIKWLEILESNFPNLLEKYKTTDFSPPKQNYSIADTKKLWENGLSTGIMLINGKAFFSPGFGKVTSGHNINVVMQSNNILHWIAHIIDNIEKNKNGIKEFADSLKLRIGERGIEIYNVDNKNILYEFPNY